jgi:hypothetical protein
MRILLMALLTAFVVLAGGCATHKESNDVSSIPWNRPQSWEGQGALGGFRPPGQGY